ncbi:MAG: glycosyltransferase family 2 protein [Pseudomonadota bacterium]
MEERKLRSCRLGVIIVNYQTPELTERCLEALAPMLADTNARAVIVDNASQDGSFERLSAYCAQSAANDRLSVVAAGANGGFSAGNNMGFRALQSEYVLLLNSDAVPRPGALNEIMKAADEAPKAGVVTPSLITSHGEEQVSRFRNHSPLSEFVDGAQSGPVTKMFPKGETPIYSDDWKTTPDWVSFAAVLLRRNAIEEVGPMDEGFFLYYEDCDYCRRIRAKGFDIGFAPNAVFVHDPGGTTKLRDSETALARLPSYYYASRSRYFRKYYGPAGPLLANVAWLTGRAIAKLRGTFGRAAPAVCAARARDLWIGWRAGLVSSHKT